MPFPPPSGVRRQPRFLGSLQPLTIEVRPCAARCWTTIPSRLLTWGRSLMWSRMSMCSQARLSPPRSAPKSSFGGSGLNESGGRCTGCCDIGARGICHYTIAAPSAGAMPARDTRHRVRFCTAPMRRGTQSVIAIVVRSSATGTPLLAPVAMPASRIASDGR